MNNILSQTLNIRYVKIHFLLEFTGFFELPIFKVSAFRGGIGEMLLRANCVRDRQCESCDFNDECIVQKIMYSNLEIRPDFMSRGDSVGYVFECEDYRKQYNPGDRITLALILFGKSIVYFSQYLNALYSLGRIGLGKNRASFQIVSVTNSRGKDLFRNGNIYMRNYEIMRISDYVAYREKQLYKPDNADNAETTFDYAISEKIMVLFKSPLTLKFKGEFIKEFNIEAILRSICRRIYILDCFEGIESNPSIIYPDESELPEILLQESRTVHVQRFSSRQDSKMVMHGLEGYAVIKNLSQNTLSLLLVAELTHIGKNTSFGFGQIRVIDKSRAGRYGNFFESAPKKVGID